MLSDTPFCFWLLHLFSTSETFDLDSFFFEGRNFEKLLKWELYLSFCKKDGFSDGNDYGNLFNDGFSDAEEGDNPGTPAMFLFL